LEYRERIRRVVVKLGLGFLVRYRQGRPELQTVHLRAVAAELGTRTLGVHDATARGHPVDLTGADRLV